MATPPDMNETNALLKKILTRLTNNRRTRKRDDIAETTEDLKDQYAKLDKEIQYNQKEVKESSMIFKKLKEELLQTMKPLAKLEDSFNDMQKALRKQMKDSEKDQRDLAQKTFGEFNKVIKTSKDATVGFNKALAATATAQQRFMAALEKAEKAKATPNEDKTGDRKKAIAAAQSSLGTKQKEIDAVSAQLKRAKSQEKKDQLAAKVVGLKEELEEHKKKIAAEQKLLLEEQEQQKQHVKHLEDIDKELEAAYNNLEEMNGGAHSLHKIQADQIKLGKATTTDYAKFKKQLGENAKGVLTAAAASNKALGQYQNQRAAQMAGMIKTTVTAIVEKTLPQLVKDFEARRYYGLNQSLGTQGVINNLGMSEAERSELVGKNQTLFRAMGQGNENSPFIRKQGEGDSEVERLQKNMLTNFGLYGKEAAEKIAEFGNTIMTSGFKPTEQNLKLFSDNLRIASTITGEAPDVIKGFYDQMQQTGQMAILNKALEGKSDKERLDFIQKNTTALILVNKNLGMSVEEMKKSNQEKFNASHAGLVATIKQGIGTSIVASEYNRLNPSDQVSKEQLQIGQMSEDEQTALIASGAKSQQDVEAAKKATQKVQAFGEQQRLAAQIGAYKSGDIVGARTKGAGAAFVSEEIGGMMNPFFDQANSLAAMRQMAQAQGQGTAGATGTNSVLAGRMQGQDINQVKVEQVNAAADGFTKALDTSAEALKKFSTQVESIFKNPLGAPAAGIFGAFKDYAALRILEKIGGRVFGGGAAAAAEGAAGGAGAAAAGGGLAGLWATLTGSVGAAGVGATAAGVGVAGAAGYGIGTGLNAAWDATKGGQRVNDAIDAVATSGLQAAAMKISAMTNPLMMMRFMMMPKDKVAQLEAHKMATNFLNDTIGKDGLQAWDSRNSNNKTIMAEMKSGAMTAQDLKDAGASDQFIQGLTDALSDDPKNKEVVELLKKLVDVAEKGNEQDQKNAEKQQYHMTSRATIEDRVNKFKRNDSDISKSISEKIASYS